MDFTNLTPENIDLYCMHNYDNPQCTSIEDYHNDMKRFKYIKRLLNQYESTKTLKVRLLLNHVIMIYNIFNNKAATRIWFFKLQSNYWPILKPLLIFLHMMPLRVTGIHSKDILNSDIQLDEKTVQELRKI